MPNLPIAFVDRIHLQFAGDAQTMLAAMHRPPGNSVLINSHKQAPLSFDTIPVPWCPAGRLLHDRPRFALDPLWHAGAYYVQESSSMLLWHVLNSLNVVDQQLAVLDACAAPGGKSLLISSWLGERGWLLSNEVNAHRNAVLRENMIKWGSGNTLVSREETHRLGRLTEKFDIILVDAPCSGEGMFRKDEEACALWSPENVSGCARRQQQLLNDLLPALKDGGWLIYSTCTYAPEENEQNARWLAGIGLEAWRFSISPAWGVDVIDEPGIFALQCRPHKVPGEGFFISAFRKTESVGSDARRQTRVREKYVRSKQQALPEWMGTTGEVLTAEGNEVLFSAPMSVSELNQLSEYIALALPGTMLGAWKGKDWIPDHAWAMCAGMIDASVSIELDYNQALEYLKGGALHVAPGFQGWAVVKHLGISLGWIKCVQGRTNNYYPKGWRLRTG